MRQRIPLRSRHALVTLELHKAWTIRLHTDSLEAQTAMPFSCCKYVPAALLLVALPAFAYPVVHGKTTKQTTVKHSVVHAKATAPAAAKPHAATHTESATAMPSERATEIQNALIQHGYLTGEPTGTWDAQTVAAMQKMQEENGWQTKITPDSRALIKLGLGGPQQTSTQ